MAKRSLIVAAALILLLEEWIWNVMRQVTARLAAHPWVARSLYDAFERAKQDWLARMASGELDGPNEKKYRKISQIVGPDPLPHGMEFNMPTILKLEDTAWKQGMIPRRVPLEQAWVDPFKM
jgi:4,5-dihydroxyphthalate decarboxylase